MRRGLETNKIRFMYLGEEMEKDWHLTSCFSTLERLVEDWED